MQKTHNPTTFLTRSLLRARRFGALLLILALVVFPAAASSDGEGMLDATFGTGGVVTTDYGPLFDEFADIVIQPDGKIVAVGSAVDGGVFKATVARYLDDGSPDVLFGDGGATLLDIGANGTDGAGVALQHDGKIIATGGTNRGAGRDVYITRLGTDGAVDPSFAVGGTFTETFTETLKVGIDTSTDIAIDDDGGIVVSAAGDTTGTPRPFVIKLTPNGAADSTFGGDGVVEVPLADGSSGELKGVGIQDDGRIVVAGDVRDGVQQDFLVARYNADGSLDTSFGSTGVVITPVGTGNDAGEDLVIQDDGRIVVAGSAVQGSTFNFALTRYNADGSLDTSFDGDGKLILPVVAGSNIAQDVVQQMDGKLIAVGVADLSVLDSAFALARFNTDGSLDATFGTGGKTLADVTSGFDVGKAVAIQADGKIVAAGGAGNFSGSPDSVLLRFNGPPPPELDETIYLPLMVK